MSELDDILDAHSKEGVTEVRTDMAIKVMHFTGEGSVTHAKTCWFVGAFDDLREIGNGEFHIYSLTGMLCRKVSFEGDYVTIDPMDGNVLCLPTSTKIFYEPWFMDRGSYLFEDEKTNNVLKLSTEYDTLDTNCLGA